MASTGAPEDYSIHAEGMTIAVVYTRWNDKVVALLLAGLNALTLFVSGGAWGVTFAFALWGSKLLDAIGVDGEAPDRADLDAAVENP